MEPFFPPPIRNLPRADIPLEGMTGYLFQGPQQQIVFSEYHKGVEIPEHSHAAQWGVVLKGRIEFTVDGKTRSYERGDMFYFPAGVVHSSRVYDEYADVIFFDQKDRFKIKG